MLLTCMGWCCLVPPVISFAVLQSRGGRVELEKHVILAVFVLMGALFEACELLMELGSASTCAWISKDFDLDYGLMPEATEGSPSSASARAQEGFGWKALEIAYITTRGARLWVDAIDWLFLGLALFAMSTSVNQARQSGRDQETFPARWGRLGALVGSLALVDFVVECAQFTIDWKLFVVTTALSLLNTLVLLPAWLLWLGVELPRCQAASSRGLAAHRDDETLATAKDAPG